MRGYQNSLEHLQDELRRLNLLIRLQVLQFRRKHQEEDQFRGLVIWDEEVDAILLADDGGKAALASEPSLCPQLQGQLASLERHISQKKQAGPDQGKSLRLEQLKRFFQLSDFEADVLLICLAAELDLKYEKLFAYLQDDVTRKRPSVDLTLNLLCEPSATAGARRVFDPTAPLIFHHLVHLANDPGDQHPPLPRRSLSADLRVVNFLLGSEEIEAFLEPYVQLIQPWKSLKELLLPGDIKEGLGRMVQGYERTGQSLILYFQGPYGVGKQSTAEALCRELGMSLLAVDGESLVNAGDLPLPRAVRLVCREAVLQKAALCWEGFEALLAEDKKALLKLWAKELGNRKGLTFLAGNVPWEPADFWHGTSFLRIELPLPGYAERLHLWANVLNGHQPPGLEMDLEALANKFRFSGGQIQDAAATASNLARWRHPDHGQIAQVDIYEACRLQSNRKLAEVAQKITPHYTWGDIVLPSDRLQQLREVCNHVKYHALVYEEWGFDRKLSLGKGLNVLFSGPSGTGKTMAAEIMAGELGLDLYKIDLSAVVSKYIGETEKNLARIFAEAETSNAILFFDEADALFGRRSEVRDSHDRYANIETSYLLQKMEEYEGTTILATNLRKNMDEAFVRRMHITVEFPFPTVTERRQIWERIWPEATPRRHDLDLDYLASRLELSGGNIRNIALAAAFLAADDGRVIDMVHLVQATKREYQKMGKVVTERDLEVPHV